MESVKLLSDIPSNFEVVYPENDLVISTLSVSLQQVFLNLYGNAFKYVESEHALLVVDWQSLDEDFITFSVSDNGSGIEARYHEKIFQMFQTLNPRDVYEGSGMGLAIIKKVIEGVGGKIWVESSVGSGAKFIFTWPKNYKYSQGV
jgi:signal transduction histidine kinase